MAIERTPTRRARSAGWYLVLSALSLLVLFPIWMGVVRAISQPFAYIEAGLPPWPVDPDLGVFTDLWTGGVLPRAMALTLVVCIVIVAAQLITSVMAAYAFAFLEFPFKDVWFAAILATMLLPIEVTLVGNVRTIRELGWLDSMQGLTVPFAASAFGIFLLRQAFLGIPRDLRDAARLDGFGHFAFVWRVVLPTTRPLVGSFVLLSALGAWNSYLWPRAVTTEESWQTLQIALRSIATSSVDSPNVGVAAALLAAVPVVVLLLIFQKQIIRGLTAGAVKG
jgi:sn-glycerol 3-phosphate transport system permease protein